MAEILDWSGHIGRRLRLRDLHVFSKVVQCGSMAKAAAQLRVTQPAISQVIADLEHVLGVSLLDRSPQGVKTTIYGDALMKGGAAAFDDLRQTIKEIEFLTNPSSGEVRIGCPETVAALMTPIVERLSRQYPGIVLHVFDVAAPTLDLPQLRDRTLDLAMIRVAGSPSVHRYGDDLDVEVLLNDETRIVVGKDSQWARRRKVDLADLAGESWILPPANSLNSAVVLDAFLTLGLGPPRVTMVTYSMQLRAKLVGSGPHVTVFPRSVLRLYADDMSLKELPIDLPPREWPIALVTLKNRMTNPGVQLFITQVREAFKTMEAGRKTEQRPKSKRLQGG
jgi:DNA-binding transcriptional LysR family regulator